MIRADQFSSSLEEQVRRLFGGPVVQTAPEFTVKLPGSDATRRVLPAGNRVEVRLVSDPRRKGLVWYPTFVCDFSGSYTLENPEEAAQKVRVAFRFPSPGGTYDNFRFDVDGRSADVPVDTSAGVGEIVEVPGRAGGQNGKRTVTVAYRTRGLSEWRYRPAPGAGLVRGLDLTVRTNCQDYDFPEGTLSPTTPAGERRAPEGGGVLRWQAGDLITAQDIGLAMPVKLNPGPLSARITWFAPVCLFFFFVIVATIGIVRGVNIHPMHYLFVAGGFFAFHLLFAYLVDHLPLHAAFALAAAAAVTLVTLYLRAALGRSFSWRWAALAELLYLVLFSYSFFLKGFTGLTVTVGAVVTLGVLMAVTARTDWGAVFGGRRRAEPAPEARPAR
jgi:hypothetical protein